MNQNRGVQHCNYARLCSMTRAATRLADSGRTCLPESLAAERHAAPASPGSPRNFVITALSLAKAGMSSALHCRAALAPPPPNDVRVRTTKDPRTGFRPGYANHGRPDWAQLCHLPVSSPPVGPW
jgi:hypothetical protein